MYELWPSHCCPLTFMLLHPFITEHDQLPVALPHLFACILRINNNGSTKRGILKIPLPRFQQVHRLPGTPIDKISIISGPIPVLQKNRPPTLLALHAQRCRTIQFGLPAIRFSDRLPALSFLDNYSCSYIIIITADKN